jgi:hypothetical protein
MQVKKLGIDVHFEYKPNLGWVQFYRIKENGKFDTHIWFYTYLGVDQQGVIEATSYLQGLITGGIKG